jgi:lipoprotein-anchoring transpeptidase ErfK/SrfK
MQRPAETSKANVNSTNQKRSPGRKRPRRRSFLFPVLLIVMGCVVFLFAAWSAITSPVLASILNISSTPLAQPTPLQSFVQVDIPKPTYTPQTLAQSDAQAYIQPQADVQPDESAPAGPLAIAPGVAPAEELSIAPVVPQVQVDVPTTDPPVLPSNTPYIAPTEPLPATAEIPGIAHAEIVADTPTSEYVAPTVAPYSPPPVAVNDGAHWIDVDLSQQRVYAYSGDTLVNSFVVSTGTWQTPTVTGKYKVWIKLRSSDMSGPGYYLPDVPYVMYFYKGYGIHGTYWHNNFGTPMSHGCVNLTIPDAEWLYNFSSVGTVVNVHY